MACCTEFQTECLKVVNIAYLNSFIGTNIQNSSGVAVQANLNALTPEKRRNDYCPTYAELTANTGTILIPKWSQNPTTPRDDTDGIVILGSYTNDQVVRQQDLMVRYTRFNSLSISSDKTTSLSECGDSTNLTLTYDYVRYSKYMKIEDCGVETTSENIDGACSDITWKSIYGSIADCSVYSIGKNGSFSANSRTDRISATTTFRTATKNSNSIDITQKALTGSYESYVSGWTTPTGIKAGSCVASPSSKKIESCYGGVVAINAVGTYDIYGKFKWVDSCGTVYENTQDQKMSSGETPLSQTYTFAYSKDCSTLDDDYTETKELTISYGGQSCSHTFTATCVSCKEPPKPEDCCKVFGSTTVYCSGSTTYRIAECGEPEECRGVIVDGSVQAIPASGNTPGDANYDASYVNETARFVVEIYNNATAAEMNIGKQEDFSKVFTRNPDEIYSSTTRFDTVGPSTASVTTRESTYYGMGKEGYYNHSRCTAAILQWRSLGSKPEDAPVCVKEGEDCGWNTYNSCPSPGTGTGPCCRTDYDHSAAMMAPLTQIGYIFPRNNSGADRVFVVWWVPPGSTDYRMCPSSLNIFPQPHN